MKGEVQKIKDWKNKKDIQFEMVEEYIVKRNCDGVFFHSFEDSTDRSPIVYNGRAGNILEFMADYKHVQIEALKEGIIYSAEKAFESELWEVLEVPINEIQKDTNRK